MLNDESLLIDAANSLRVSNEEGALFITLAIASLTYGCVAYDDKSMVNV